MIENTAIELMKCRNRKEFDEKKQGITATSKSITWEYIKQLRKSLSRTEKRKLKALI